LKKIFSYILPIAEVHLYLSFDGSVGNMTEPWQVASRSHTRSWVVQRWRRLFQVRATVMAGICLRLGEDWAHTHIQVLSSMILSAVLAIPSSRSIRRRNTSLVWRHASKGTWPRGRTPPNFSFGWNYLIYSTSSRCWFDVKWNGEWSIQRKDRRDDMLLTTVHVEWTVCNVRALFDQNVQLSETLRQHMTDLVNDESRFKNVLDGPSQSKMAVVELFTLGH